MNAKLILFLFVSNVVTGLCSNEISHEKLTYASHRNTSKFQYFDSKSLNIELPNYDDTVLDTPYSCTSIVSYYIGILKNKNSPQTYNVQFQLRLWLNKNAQKIHIQIDNWNEKYFDSGNFELDFYYDGNRKWCDIYSNCTIPFVKKMSYFKVDLNTADGNYFHLISFNSFNNSFVLNDPIGQCTKSQLDDLNDNYTPDLNKLTFCTCCNGEYKPAELLGCPNNKWENREGTTCKPCPTQNPIITTCQPIPTENPQPQNITCSSLIGYYSGRFQNTNYPTKFIDVEFQTRLKADETAKKIYFIIDQWNRQKTDMNDTDLEAWDSETSEHCSPMDRLNCSVPFLREPNGYFKIFLNHYNHTSGRWDNEYSFLEYTNFSNIFTLTNAIGQCTKNQWQDLSNKDTVNSTLYEYCLCCGGEYLPDPKLGCPKNPWK